MSDREKVVEEDRYSLEEILGDIQCAVHSATRFSLQGSYRELSLARTKLQEAEMWVQKLLEGGKE